MRKRAITHTTPLHPPTLLTTKALMASSSPNNKSEGDSTSGVKVGKVKVAKEPAYMPILRRWSPLEDAKLIVHVLLHGPRLWKKIGEQLQKRSAHACRVRWTNYLRPGVRGSPFNNMEQLELMLAHAQRREYLLSRSETNAVFHRRSGSGTLFVNPSAATAAAAAAVSPARSSVNSANSAAGIHNDRSRIIPTSGTNFKCIACRLNWHSDAVQGGRAFMADCGICRRVLEIGGDHRHDHMLIKGEKKTHMDDRSPPPAAVVINPSVMISSLELSLATTVSAPSPPPPPPPASPPTPASSPPPPANFIDFLGGPGSL